MSQDHAAQWQTMSRLFDAMRTMAAEMIEKFPADQFDQPRGESNSVKWIAGHLAWSVDAGLHLLGQPAEHFEGMMATYGAGSPGGAVGDDGRTQAELVDQFRTRGDQLRSAVIAAEPEQFTAPNETPFLAEALPTVGDLLAHVYTTHIALHLGQVSQIRREMGFDSYYDFG